MNILLVEPDKILGRIISRALIKSGDTVVWERSAQGALDALDSQKIDLLILEIQLGLHNGIELLYEMTSYPEWQDVPIIIHTINSKILDPAYAKTLAQLKVAEVLYKPQTSTLKLINATKHFMAVT